MKNIFLSLICLLCFSGVYGQTVYTNDTDFMNSISNLPQPLVEMVDAKVKTLSVQAKQELLNFSDMRSAVTNSKMAVDLHKNMNTWMNSYFTSQEKSAIEAAMSSTLKQNN